MMPQLVRSFRAHCAGHGIDRGAFLLRIFAIQSCGGRCDGSLGAEEVLPMAAAVVGVGALLIRLWQQ